MKYFKTKPPLLKGVHTLPIIFSICRSLLSASQDGKLIVWDGFTTSKVSIVYAFRRQFLLSVTDSCFLFLHFRTLVSASQDGKLIVWDCVRNNKVSALVVWQSCFWCFWVLFLIFTARRFLRPLFPTLFIVQYPILFIDQTK